MQNKIETTINNFFVEYMLNEVSIHVFVSSSKKVMKSVLEQSFLSCPAVSYDILVTQQ